MKAIILAAGMGKRLGKYTKGGTKCMVKVNGKALIEYAIDSLQAAGVTNITLVVGYKAEKLKSFIQKRYSDSTIEYIENPIYDKTNNIYSLWLAKEVLCSDDCILLESDLIYKPELIADIIESPEPNLAAVSKFESWMDGTVTTLDEDNSIISVIGKLQFCWNDIEHYYKTVNIYKFSRDFSINRYIPFLEAFISVYGTNEYYEQVLRVLVYMENSGLKGYQVDPKSWYEIDDPHDLNIAETIFADPETKLQLIQQRYGGYWRFPGLTDFCYLVNPYFPTERMWNEMNSNIREITSQYPSGMKIQSILAGKIFSIDPERIAVGNGAAELIASLLRFTEGMVGIIEPTFNEYSERAGIDRVVKFIVNSDFSYKPNEVVSAWADGKAACGILINPDNPSGHFFTRKEVEEFIDMCQASGIRPVVDESFVDFAEPEMRFSLLNDDFLIKHPSLVVIRSISKSYGVAGLRLGVLATGDEVLINAIKRDVAIWNINSPAEYFLQIFDKYKTDYLRACDKIAEERTVFSNMLESLEDVTVFPSQANYLLCKIDNSLDCQTISEYLLAEHGVFAKSLSTKKGFPDGEFIRVAVRKHRDNERFVSAMKSVLSSKRCIENIFDDNDLHASDDYVELSEPKGDNNFSLDEIN